EGFGPEWLGAAAIVWLLGLTAWPPVILSDATFGSNVRPEQHLMENGVNEERQYYYPFTGLLTARPDRAMPNHPWYRLGLEARGLGPHVANPDAAGFIGYGAGPDVHYVDRWALGDPLLARLPIEVPWRVGHYVRRPPEGYIETLNQGVNLIKDPGVHFYY